jgi:hypothetical protein
MKWYYFTNGEYVEVPRWFVSDYAYFLETVLDYFIVSSWAFGDQIGWLAPINPQECEPQ